MRRIILASVAGLVLVVAGVAVANGFDSKAVKQASATFAATAASNLRTSTCTGTDGTYTKTVATYTGSASSSEPSLSGAARIEAASFVNTTTGVGTVWGNAPDRHRLGTHVVQLPGRAHPRVGGRPRSGSQPRRQPAGEPLGRLQRSRRVRQRQDRRRHRGRRRRADHAGSGADPPRPPKPERVKARGAISAVSPTSITRRRRHLRRAGQPAEHGRQAADGRRRLDRVRRRERREHAQGRSRATTHDRR